MRLETSVLAVPVAPGNGAAQSVRDLRDKYVQVGGTFVGSLDLEISLDGSSYVKSAIAITDPGVRSISEPALYVRMVVTDLTSGTPTAVINGYNTRTD